MNLSGAASIIGIGASDFERRPERSVLTLASTALHAALDDAGLEKEAIDGLIVQVGSPRGPDYDAVAATFGLSPAFCSQTWSHGRFAATVLIQAAMAVATGMASRVACLMAMKNSDIGRIGEANNPFYNEQFREGGGPHGEEGHIGMVSPIAGAALGFDRYLKRYGQAREKLSAVPMTFRAHAAMTDDAVMKKPMTLADYEAARPIIDPLRLLDCSLVGDGAVCAIVGGREESKSCRKPVTLTGLQGIEAGRETFIFAPRGLGVAQQSDNRRSLEEARTRQVYQMAGTGPDGIDVLGVYDSFSPLAVYALEEFGFCAAGEGLDFIQNGQIGLKGALPTNTSGGQLSQAQLNGWGQIRELVTQLRGEAGPRQVPGAKRAMWASVGGDAFILEAE